MSKFCRICGGVKPTFRLFGGIERRDLVLYKGKELKGFVRFRKQNHETITETCFKNVRLNVVESVPGFDPVWLARKNNLTVKV